MRRKSSNRRLHTERLEQRELLAVTAVDDAFAIPVDKLLQVSESQGGGFEGLESLADFDAQGNVTQLEFSPEFNLLFMRNSGSAVRVLDTTTGDVVSTQIASASFTDFDLSPSGRSLFASEFINGLYHVHRFDLTSRTWESKKTDNVSWRIEAVSDDAFLLQEEDQWVAITLNSFGEAGEEITELAEISSNFHGDIEYNNHSREVYHGNSRLSSDEIHSYSVGENSIALIDSTDTYGSADGYGGSVTLSSDGQHLYYGKLQVEASDVRNNLRVFPETILAASGDVAFGETSYYDARTGEVLGNLGFSTTAIFVSDDGRHVWAFQPNSDRVHHMVIQANGFGVLANDTTDSLLGGLEARALSQPTNGELTFSSDGTFSYQPNDGFSGLDSFTYIATNGLGESDTATVVISVDAPVAENLAPSGDDKTYYVDQGQPLFIDAERGDISTGIDEIRSLDSSGNVAQIEFSSAFDIVAVRNSGSAVRILDGTTGSVLSTRLATESFTDMDLTADGRYLFVADYGDEVRGHGNPIRPHWVHRFDLSTLEWQTKQAPKIAWRIEAVASDRVLLQEHDQHVDMTLNSFPDGEQTAMAELDRISANYYGDFEYDANTGRVYHGNTGSSSHEIHVRTLNGDSLINSGSSGTYGTAQGYRGPSLLSSDGSSFYYGRLQVEALDVTNNTNVMPEIIYAANGNLAFGETAVYDADDGRQLTENAFLSTVQNVSENGENLWSFNADTDRLHHYRLRMQQVGLLAHDRDDNDTLSVELISGPTNGSLERFESNGEVQYVPDDDFVGMDSFTYRVFDGELYSEPIEVDINVIATNGVQVPANASPDAFEIGEGQTLVVDSGLAPESSLVEVQDFAGSAQQIEYSPKFGILATRLESIVRLYDVTTQTELTSIRAEHKFTDFDMTPDGRYLFVADYAGEVMGSGTPLDTHWVHRYDMASGLWLSKKAPKIAWKIEAISDDRVLLQEHDQHVSMTLNDYGTIDAAPIVEIASVRADYYGDFEFDINTGRVYHGSTGSSSHEIHVRTVRDDAFVNNGSSGVYGTAQGYRGTSVLSSGGLHFYYGRLQVEALDVTNNLNVFPESILAASDTIAFGAHSYYTAKDATRLGAAGFDVAHVTDDGRHLWALKDGRLQHYQLGSYRLGILSNDSTLDGQLLSAALVSGPQNGQLELNEDGGFRYTPNAGFVGTDSFTYRAVNGDLSSEPTVVSIEVDPINRAPVIEPIEDQVTREDEPLGPLAISISDPSSHADEISVWATVDNDLLVDEIQLSGTGFQRQLLLRPHANRSGETRVTIHAFDGEFQTTESFQLQITEVNDEPIVIDDFYFVDQSVTLTVSEAAGVLVNDFDIEDEALSLMLVTGTSNGALGINPDGSFSYQPDEGFTGDDGFTYLVTDSGGAATMGSVTLRVRDVNAPTVTSISLDDHAAYAGDFLVQISFSEDVQVSQGQLMYLIAEGQLTSPSGTWYDSTTQTLTASFLNVPSGNYTLRIRDAAVNDPFGNRLDGDFDAAPGGDYLYRFEVRDSTHILEVAPSVDVVHPGESVSVSVGYDRRGAERHTGLAIRVHFDSSVLEWSGNGSLYEPSLLVAGSPTHDEADFDADPSTDAFVLLAWNDIDGDWPLSTRRINLAEVSFEAADVLQVEGKAAINVTHADGPSGYLFEGNDASLDIVTNFDAFDVDLDGLVSAETDGVLITRHLLGVQGELLTQDAIAPNSQRADATEITDYLASISTLLDVDASGEASSFTDGVMISRYLAGWDGPALIENALSPTANRVQSAEIKTWLDSWNPRFASDAPGDLDGDGTIDAEDLEMLHSAVLNQRTDAAFDMNRDQVVDVEDVMTFLSENKQSGPGDANYDGRFDSSDFVTVFQQGLYETGLAASWAAGDWNCDGVFSTQDLVFALQRGQYVDSAAISAAAIDHLLDEG